MTSLALVLLSVVTTGAAPGAETRPADGPLRCATSWVGTRSAAVRSGQDAAEWMRVLPDGILLARVQFDRNSKTERSSEA